MVNTHFLSCDKIVIRHFKVDWFGMTDWCALCVEWK